MCFFLFFRKYCDILLKNVAEKVYTGFQPEISLLSLKAKPQTKLRPTKDFKTLH